MSHTLTLKQLTLTRGTQTLCRDLTLTIQPGDYWGILGANGSGKTTLLHSLCGQYQPTSGQILLNNQVLKKLPTRTIAQHIGILFQDAEQNFPQTVFEYCQSARFPHHSLFTLPQQSDADTERVHAAVQSVQLSAHSQHNIQHLSGGEKRRAGIAALLVQDPVFFLLDEPANHLDLRHQIETMNLFAALSSSQQHAVVMSLHDINLAERYCNKILMIFPDGTTKHGPRHALLNQENLSRLYQHPIDVIHDGAHTYWLPGFVKTAI